MVTMPAESRSSLHVVVYTSSVTLRPTLRRLHVVLHVVAICMDQSTKQFDYV
jgi:hypothetical protein